MTEIADLREDVAGMRNGMGELASRVEALTNALTRGTDLDEKTAKLHAQLPSLLEEFRASVEEKRQLAVRMEESASTMRALQKEMSEKATKSDVEEKEREEAARKHTFNTRTLPLMLVIFLLIVSVFAYSIRSNHTVSSQAKEAALQAKDAADRANAAIQNLKDDQLANALRSYEGCVTRNTQIASAASGTAVFFGLIDSITAALPAGQLGDIARAKDAEIHILAAKSKPQKQVDCAQFQLLAQQLRAQGAKDSP